MYTRQLKATTDYSAILPKLNSRYFQTASQRTCVFHSTFLCRLDDACVHTYCSTTTDCYGPPALHIVKLCWIFPSLSLKDALFHSPTMFESTRTTWQPIAQWLRPYCLTNTDWYFLRLPNKMHFSTRQFTLSTWQCLCSLVRLDNRLIRPSSALQKIFSKTRSLMRCIFPLDNFLCRPDNACVHSYDSYDPTTNCCGPVLPYKRYFLRLPNEMHFSTRQFTLSTRQCRLSTRTTRTSRQLIVRALLPSKHGLIFSKSP